MAVNGQSGGLNSTVVKFYAENILIGPGPAFNIAPATHAQRTFCFQVTGSNPAHATLSSPTSPFPYFSPNEAPSVLGGATGPG